jgi:hypothetical protein
MTFGILCHIAACLAGQQLKSNGLLANENVNAPEPRDPFNLPETDENFTRI